MYCYNCTMNNPHHPAPCLCWIADKPTVDQAQKLLDVCMEHHNSGKSMKHNGSDYASAIEFTYDTFEYEGVTDRTDLTILKKALLMRRVKTLASLIESYKINAVPIIMDIQASMC